MYLLVPGLTLILLLLSIIELAQYFLQSLNLIETLALFIEDFEFLVLGIFDPLGKFFNRLRDELPGVKLQTQSDESDEAQRGQSGFN